jgi:hypothetical protein
MSDRAFFEQEFPLGLTEHGRVLDCATVANTFYAVVQNNESAGGIDADRAWMLVVLIQRTRAEYFNFTYKEMSEEMGPNEARCPRRLLELIEILRPEPGEYAANWRKSCWENIHKADAAKQVKAGTHVFFKNAITFTDDTTASEFQFVKRSTFRKCINGIPGYGLYRITNWRQKSFALEPYKAEVSA